MVTSSAEVGSSAISTLGLQASAMAIMARWRMPPESWCGYSLTRCCGSGMPTSCSISMARAERGLARHVLVQDQRLADLPADGHDRIERGHRLLEDHGDLVAADAAHGGLVEGDEVDAVEPDGAADDAAGRIGDQAHQGERGDALAAAGFADDGQRLAALEREGHAVDGLDEAGARVEVGLQVVDLEHALGGRGRPRRCCHAGGRSAAIRCAAAGRGCRGGRRRTGWCRTPRR